MDHILEWTITLLLLGGLALAASGFGPSLLRALWRNRRVRPLSRRDDNYDRKLTTIAHIYLA